MLNGWKFLVYLFLTMKNGRNMKMLAQG